MERHLNTIAGLMLAALTLFAASAARAECTALDLRFGLINGDRCTITEEEFYRALKIYQLRKEGYEVAEYKPPEPPPLPDLQVELNAAFPSSGFLELEATVNNNGTADAAASEVSAIVEFHSVGTPGVTIAGPVSNMVSMLPAGDRQRVRLSGAAIPDISFTWDVVVKLTADSGFAVQESNETNNSETVFCRLLGLEEVIYPGAGDPPLCTSI